MTSANLRVRRHAKKSVPLWFLSSAIISAVGAFLVIMVISSSLPTYSDKMADYRQSISDCESGLNNYGADKTPIRPTDTENAEFLEWQCGKDFREPSANYRAKAIPLTLLMVFPAAGYFMFASTFYDKYLEVDSDEDED